MGNVSNCQSLHEDAPLITVNKVTTPSQKIYKNPTDDSLMVESEDEPEDMSNKPHTIDLVGMRLCLVNEASNNDNILPQQVDSAMMKTYRKLLCMGFDDNLCFQASKKFKGDFRSSFFECA
eukprot:221832_1